MKSLYLIIFITFSCIFSKPLPLEEEENNEIPARIKNDRFLKNPNFAAKWNGSPYHNPFNINTNRKPQWYELPKYVWNNPGKLYDSAEKFTKEVVEEGKKIGKKVWNDPEKFAKQVVENGKKFGENVVIPRGKKIGGKIHDFMNELLVPRELN